MPKGLQRSAPRRSGFTLLELLVFLAVLSCVASLAVPAFFERGEVTLDNACKLLAKDLRFAQNRAAFQRSPMRMELRPDGDGYRILDASGRELRHPLGDGGLSRRYSHDGVFRGVFISHIDCGTPEGTSIEYDAQGFALRDARVVVQFMGDARIVLMHAPRGEIEIVGGSNERWSEHDPLALPARRKH